MAAQLTIRNRRRNMMSALAATVLMSSVSVMRTMMRPETAIEMWGVRFRAWSRPRTRGRPPSRPMANATRLEEKMREVRADRKSVVEGKSGELGGRRIIKKKKERDDEVAVNQG